MKPAVFIAENVKGFPACGFGEQVLDDFFLPGHSTVSQTWMASDYGVRQNRKKLFTADVRGDVPFFCTVPSESVDDRRCRPASIPLRHPSR